MSKFSFIKTILFLGDIVAVQVALFLALFFRNYHLLLQFGDFSYRFILLYAIWLLIIFILNLYDSYFFTKPLDFFFNVVIFFVTAFLLSVLCLYFIPLFSVAPKTILVLNLFFFTTIFFLWRWGVHLFLKKYKFINFDNKSNEQVSKKISFNGLSEAWFLEIISRKENKLEEFLKRFLDVVVSILGLAVCGVLILIIGPAILIDSRGGIFYSQERVGKNGKVFLIYKFRTMHQNDGRQQALWREKDKNSITRVGKVLRRLHLDELPQAWSILMGDLSFVGPRPEWVEFARVFEKEIPFYKYRYLVKPGIIGWAQVNFPPSQSVKEAQDKFEYDLYYIKNRSLLLDLEIMLKAVKLFFF